MKIYIRGFAELRKEVERKLSEHTDVVIEHLMKCYLMPNHSALIHWKQEIATQINRVDKLKNGKKFPSAKQIYNWTYGKKQDLVTDIRWFSGLVQDVCDEYNLILENDPLDFQSEFDKLCQNYFEWLANELSVRGLVPRSEIYTKLDALL